MKEGTVVFAVPLSMGENTITAGNRLTAREAALKALYRVEQDDAYLNLVLPALVKQLNHLERALAVQIAAGTIQRRNTVDWALELFLKRPLAGMTPWMRNLLRMAAFQLLYLERVPAHAVVDEAVRLARRYGHRGVAGLVNAVLRRLDVERGRLPWPDSRERPAEYMALRFSHPVWLVERWIRRYGLSEAAALCRFNNEISPLSIRPNLLRTDPGRLGEKLAAEGVTAVESPLLPGMLRIKTQRPLDKLAAFREGLFTVQGESSAMVVPLLDPRPGEYVVDLCSAPGGKTTHLAELMNDRGRIIAVDIHAHRLRLVEKAARRLGLGTIETMAVDGKEIGRCGLTPPHRILVDAPCSGFGVIRRLPELKWRRREEDLPAMRQVQLELLESAAGILRPGGRLLYSVCSNEPEETQAVAEEFTRCNPHFNPVPLDKLPAGLPGTAPEVGAMELWPHRHGMDGFFIALWERKHETLVRKNELPDTISN